MGTGKEYSALEIVKAFEVASGQSIPYQVASRRPGDVASCYTKVDKALVELDWKTQHSLSQMSGSAGAWEMNYKYLDKDWGFL